MVQRQLISYESGSPSYFIDKNVIYDGGNKSIQYTFQGYAIKANPDTPITKKDNQYITVYPTYDAFPTSSVNGYVGQQTSSDVYYNAEKLKFKVSDVVGDLILISKDTPIIKHQDIGPELENTQINLTPYSFPVAVYNGNVPDVFSAENPNNYVPLNYNFTVTEEINIDDQAVYVTDKSYSRDEFLSILSNQTSVVGFLKGDGYMCRARKEFRSATSTIYLYADGTNFVGDGEPVIVENAVVRYNAFGWYGTFISMSPKDIWRSEWNQDIGQVNTTNYLDSKNLRQDNQICFSNPTVGSTQVNGLNKFNSADFRSAPVENGPITALINTNATQREPGVLLAVGAYGVSSFYYDAVQLTNVDGTSNVTTTNSYLASQRPLLGQFGTSRPMSITKTPLSTVYWWSDVVNDMIRYSNAGLERLGLTYSFSNYLRQTYGGNSLITTWYDQVTDEINLVGKGLATATFSERYKTFQGTRSYINGDISPERSIGAATKFYNFLGGEIWKTDVNNTAANDSQLFGEYKMPKVAIITNEQPAVMKTWNQIKMFGPHPTTTELVAVANSTVSSGNLLSSIDYNWWIERKNVWEAAIRRSITSQGGVLAGKIMESRILYSIFAFDPQSFDKINFIEVKSNSSIVQ
jgi:hypothetical protein